MLPGDYLQGQSVSIEIQVELKTYHSPFFTVNEDKHDELRRKAQDLIRAEFERIEYAELLEMPLGITTSSFLGLEFGIIQSLDNEEYTLSVVQLIKVGTNGRSFWSYNYLYQDSGDELDDLLSVFFSGYEFVYLDPLHNDLLEGME